MEKDEVTKKLDILIRLIALGQTNKMKESETIEHLWKAGLEYKQIAEIVGKTENSVAVKIHRLKREAENDKKESK